MPTYPVIKVPEPFSVLEHPPPAPRLRFSALSGLALGGLVIALLLAGGDRRWLMLAGLAMATTLIDTGYSLWRYHRALAQDLWQRRRQQVKGLTIVAYTQPTSIEPEVLASQLASALAQLPEVEVKQQQRLGDYTLEIILQDLSLGVWCCIEVDEPWFFRAGGQKCANHWQGKDDLRDEYCLDCGWIVIRFAESQVAMDLPGCVQEVAGILARFNPRRPRVQSPLRRVARWREQDALRIPRVYTPWDR